MDEKEISKKHLFLEVDEDLTDITREYCKDVGIGTHMYDHLFGKLEGFDSPERAAALRAFKNICLFAGMYAVKVKKIKVKLLKKSLPEQMKMSEDDFKKEMAKLAPQMNKEKKGDSSYIG